MEQFCKFCGEPLEEGVCPNKHTYKKMCLNCEYCGKNEKSELVCKNEDNFKAAFDKIMAAVSGVTQSYSVKNLVIEPIPLKKPTAKCGSWKLSDAVLGEIEDSFK